MADRLDHCGIYSGFFRFSDLFRQTGFVRLTRHRQARAWASDATGYCNPPTCWATMLPAC